jgi:hypothetical protein
LGSYVRIVDPVEQSDRETRMLLAGASLGVIGATLPSLLSVIANVLWGWVQRRRRRLIRPGARPGHGGGVPPQTNARRDDSSRAGASSDGGIRLPAPPRPYDPRGDVGGDIRLTPEADGLPRGLTGDESPVSDGGVELLINGNNGPAMPSEQVDPGDQASQGFPKG